MDSTLTPIRISLLTAALIISTWLPSQSAFADTPGVTSGVTSVSLKRCQLEGNKIVVVGKGGGSCTISVHWSSPINIHIPANAHVRLEHPPVFRIEHDVTAHQVDVEVLDKSAIDAKARIHLDIRPEYSATVHVYIASDASRSKNWTVKHRTETEARALLQAANAQKQTAQAQRDTDDARAKAKEEKKRADRATAAKVKQARRFAATINAKDKQHQQILAAKDAKHKQELAAKDEKIEKLTQERDHAHAQREIAERQRDEELDKLAEKEIVSGLVEGHETVAINQNDERTQGVVLRGLQWVHSGDRHFLRFTVKNNRGKKTELNRLELHDEAGEDHAGAAQIGDGVASGEKVIAILEPRETVVGTVAVNDFESLGNSVKLIVGGIDVRPAFRVVPIDPLEPPPLTPREKRARQVMVGVSGSVGLFWIADGLGEGQLDATDYRGFGVRLVKGINDMVAVEVELSGGVTGTARFANMMIDGTEGELTRSASFGRAGFGGLLRFGDKVTPYLRAGLAGQVASFDAAFTEAVDMDESSYEFSMLLTAGGGVQVRLGENWLLGVALSAETPLGGSDGDLFGRAFSFGGHVAYGW